MHLLFLDEAGCPGALKSSTDSVQPVFVISGLIISSYHINDITNEFLDIKKQFNPHVFNQAKRLDIAKWEIKGSEIRKDTKHKNRNKRRRAFRLVDKVFDLLVKYDCKLLSKTYVKGPGEEFDGRAVYTSTAQNFCAHFNVFLEEVSSEGIVVCDSRNYSMNSNLSHSVFTQKYSHGSARKYTRLIETPLFGHSDNHAMLQLVDLVSSAVIFPSCAYAYCYGHVENCHVDEKYSAIRDRYGKRLKELAYRYKDNEERWRGGVVVYDPISQKGASEILKPAT